jgi:hypothetical protein
MNAAKLLNTKSAMIAVGILAGAAVVYYAGRKFIKGALDAPDDFNRGTAYDSDESGPVGTAVRTAANAANQLSGGYLEQFGGWLGGWIYDLTHEEYDPNK